MRVIPKRIKNLSFLLIEDFFTPQELQEVEKEVQDLKRFFVPATVTGASTDEKGKLQKTGSGIFLDDLYHANRESSAILKGNRKLFSEEFMETAESFDASFGYIRNSNDDTSLLNYYIDGQEYKAHRDCSRVSAITFLRQGEFTGGEFKFLSQGVELEAIHNRMVLFPSCVLHQAMPVCGEGARISIAQFVNYTPNNL